MTFDIDFSFMIYMGSRPQCPINDPRNLESFRVVVEPTPRKLLRVVSCALKGEISLSATMRPLLAVVNDNVKSKTVETPNLIVTEHYLNSGYVMIFFLQKTIIYVWL